MTDEAPLQINYAPGILVIDDEAHIRNACQLVLEESGYAVCLAATGTEGLQRIEQDHYDIILLDLMMPELSGFDVLAQVKARHPDTAIIVITGYATIEHSVDAMKQGAFDFIPKPFTPDLLRVTVSKAIDYTRALRDIADTQSRVRTMVNRLSDGVMCTNHLHSVVLANPSFLRMTGVTAESVKGRQIDEFIANAHLRQMIRQALGGEEREGVETNAEIVVPEPNGSGELILDASCTPFRDRGGRILGVITVLHDVTAVKRIDRMKSEFVSMVSHEIRSPMNSVLMQLKVVLDGLAGAVTEKQRNIMDRASKKIASLAAMTSELLDLARIESGLMTQEREAVDMVALLREQVAFHRPYATASSVRIDLDAPAALPPVMANRRGLEEVLSNLITNAIKYSPGGGSVTVSASQGAETLCIRVQDTGLGLDPEEMKLIFNRFYRVKNEKTRYIEGTGLGLALVKSIVEFHQGRIAVSSRPGEGSAFSVFIPLMAA